MRHQISDVLVRETLMSIKDYIILALVFLRKVYSESVPSIVATLQSNHWFSDWHLEYIGVKGGLLWNMIKLAFIPLFDDIPRVIKKKI